jgi:uncharacterized protein (DUF111 family)
MKKNRIGQLIKVLAEISATENVIEIMFKYSKTLGVRYYNVHRVALNRIQKRVKTPYGEVQVKIAGNTVSAEYEDCCKLALEKGISINEIMQSAEELGRKLRNKPV